MNKTILEIKELIRKECAELGKVDDWFYDAHLLAVEDFALKLLDKLPEADKNITMLGVWLHDIQRVRGLEGDHVYAGAAEAEKLLQELGYNQEIIQKVKKIIQTHRCNSDELPDSVEGKILASADAMSHYTNDFYLHIACRGKRTPENFKAWVLEKLDRDFNKKISFDFARDMVRERHQTIYNFVTLQ